MKIKFIFLALLLLLMLPGLTGCSQNEYDPEDSVTSLLTGEYEKNGIWKLHVNVDGEPLENYGHVRFESRYLNEADLRFVDVIPGQARVEFKDVALTATERGYTFSIRHSQSGRILVIDGTVSYGEMSVDIRMGGGLNSGYSVCMFPLIP